MLDVMIEIGSYITFPPLHIQAQLTSSDASLSPSVAFFVLVLTKSSLSSTPFCTNHFLFNADRDGFHPF